MRKLTLLRIVGCTLFISLLLFPVNSVVHIGEGNVFTKYFTEPIEVLYIIFYDGHLIRFTTYHEGAVDVDYWIFKETIEKKGRKIGDIVIVIHNHLPGYGLKLSLEDLRFLGRMRGDGFKGSLCLYTPARKITCKRCDE